MTTGPLISVVIPAHNASRWIAESVASAVRQTWSNLEILVVDDGSDDNTAEVVAAVADSRVQLLRQENRGAAAARNRGLRNARGDFIQFLDADDLLAPDKLARQLEALGSAPLGSVASCAWGRFSGDPASAVFADEPVWSESDPVEWLITSLGGGGMMQPAAWLVPRQVVDAAGPWNESLSLHDDGEFFTRVLLRASRNIFVPEAKVFYRDVPGSLSRRRSRAAAVSALAVCRARHQCLLEARDSGASRRALATQYAQFAYEIGTTEPDLARQAVLEISGLGVPPLAHVGGRSFRFVAALFGFEVARRLREVASRHRG